MASSARIDELKKKFDENPRRYFAPLANEFRKAGDVSQAILICEEFLPAQPGHMSGHIVYGQALYESNRLDEARATFETALDLDPENVIALRHLGDIASTQGDSGAAKVWYWRVLDADPRNEEIQALIASLPAEQGIEPTTASAAPREPFRESHPAPVAPAPGLHTPAESMRAQPSTAFEMDAPSYAPSNGGNQHPELLDLTLEDTPAEPSNALGTEEPAREVTAAELDAATSLHVPLSEFSLEGMESESETDSLMPAITAAPEGLESVEFVPPESATGDSLELDESFEAGIDSFAVPPVRYGSLPGLESSGSEQNAHGQSSTDATPLDIEGGLIPERDEPFAIDDPSAYDASDPAAWAPVSDAPIELPPSVIAAEAELIERGESPGPADFVDPSLDERQPDEREQLTPSFDERAVSFEEITRDDRAANAPVHDDVMIDPNAAMNDDAAINEDATIDPDVSAFPEWEAALAAAEPAPVQEGAPAPVEQHEAQGTAASLDEEEYDDGTSLLARRPFVTETMAELYVKQGFREEALSVYRQLLDASPDDERLRARVADLETVPTATTDNGPNVRDFFARLASRVPGAGEVAETPPSNDDFAADDDVSADEQFASFDQLATNDQFASNDDFASFDAIEAPTTGVAQETQALESASGSIDALFGSDTRADATDSTSSALAEAFAPESNVPPLSGRPARAATGELSLESVFRDGAQGGARRSQSFSFDQFFAEGAVANSESAARPTPRQAPEIPPPGEPAERGADDIEQFNAWLQSLKQR